jgi:chemotaxis protein CheD
MTTSVGQVATVGLGELKTATSADTVLMALGLGSCVGIAMFDPKAQVGGMAHVVLPAPLDNSQVKSPKFAAGAVVSLIEQVLRLGAERQRLVCKIVGGAQVLSAGAMRDNFRIGERNVEAVNAALAGAGIKVQASDCGGSTGRSFRLTVHDGRVAVKRLGQDWRDL